MSTEVIFTVPHNPVPQPRRTQSDKWAMKTPGSRSDILNRLYKWREAVAWTYKMAKGRPKDFFRKCRMGFKFYVVGYPHSDVSNYIKGVEDSLVGVAFEDDNARILCGYYDDPDVIFLCDTCPDNKNGQGCGMVRLCNKGRAEIKIKSVD